MNTNPQISSSSNKIFEDTSRVIEEIISEHLPLIISENHYNERYIHHIFSSLMKEKGYPVSLAYSNVGSTNDAVPVKGFLHPEWATYIKGTGPEPERDGGIYRDKDNFYKVCKEIKKNRSDEDGGSRGCIDFAVGDYSHPACAVEFKMRDGVDRKGIAFDYLKLLDSRSTIDSAISLVVVYRGNKKTSVIRDFQGMELESLFVNQLKDLDNYNELEYLDLSRPHIFHIVEIQESGSGRVLRRLECTTDAFNENLRIKFLSV